MKKLDDISALVVLWQSLPDGMAREDIFVQVHNKVKGMMLSKIPAGAYYSGQKEDVLQEMAICLFEAMGRFKTDNDTKFTTYFMFYIKKALLVYRQSSRVMMQSYAAYKLGQHAAPVSITFDEAYHAGTVDIYREIKTIEQRLDLDKIIHKLRPEELNVLTYALDGLNQKATALKIGLSRERVRQLLDDAICVLQNKPRITSATQQKKYYADKNRKSKKLKGAKK